MISIIAALIACAGSITAAVITTRKAGPAGVAPTVPVFGAVNPVADPPRISRAFWLGLAGMVAWIVPLVAYVLVLPGLYIGIREQNGPRRLTGTGIALCAVSLGLAVLNSAIGAYQGAHGTGWWQ